LKYWVVEEPKALAKGKLFCFWSASRRCKAQEDGCAYSSCHQEPQKNEGRTGYRVY